MYEFIFNDRFYVPLHFSFLYLYKDGFDVAFYISLNAKVSGFLSVECLVNAAIFCYVLYLCFKLDLGRNCT